MLEERMAGRLAAGALVDENRISKAADVPGVSGCKSI
jgi:hypothetical protein